MARKLLVGGAIFVLGLVAALALGRRPGPLSAGATAGLLVLIALAFEAMGVYALASGRVYGRTWEKYWGGWVYRSQNPGYYWAYTAMYLLAGAMVLCGCGALR